MLFINFFCATVKVERKLFLLQKWLLSTIICDIEMTRLTFCCHYDNHYDNDRHGLLLLALINLIR